MYIAAPLRGSPLALLCSFTFSHTLHSGPTSSLFPSFFFLGHSHFLCPSSLHPKHFTTSLTTSCLLISLTPHYITQFFNTSNLFSPTVFFSCSSPLLHFQARCPNFPQCLHNLPSLPSSSALNLARARLSLSILLMSLLYWFIGSETWCDILDRYGCCKKRDLYLLRVRCLLLRAHSMSAGAHKSSPSQVPTALLTTALIILWLSLHRGDPYTNCLFKDAAIFLYVDWSQWTSSTKCIEWKRVQVY